LRKSPNIVLIRCLLLGLMKIELVATSTSVFGFRLITVPRFSHVQATNSWEVVPALPESWVLAELALVRKRLRQSFPQPSDASQATLLTPDFARPS